VPILDLILILTRFRSPVESRLAYGLYQTLNGVGDLFNDLISASNFEANFIALLEKYGNKIDGLLPWESGWRFAEAISEPQGGSYHMFVHRLRALLATDLFSPGGMGSDTQSNGRDPPQNQ
jgi:hypothetical protein